MKMFLCTMFLAYLIVFDVRLVHDTSYEEDCMYLIYQGERVAGGCK